MGAFDSLSLFLFSNRTVSPSFFCILLNLPIDDSRVCLFNITYRCPHKSQTCDLTVVYTLKGLLTTFFFVFFPKFDKFLDCHGTAVYILDDDAVQ